MRGKHLYQVLQQPPEELHSLVEQQLMLETIMLSPDDRAIDVAGLKTAVKERAKDAKTEEDYDRIEAELLKQFGAELLEEKTTAEAQPQPSTDGPAKKETVDAKS
jgi:F-type H+-transporting ATPase subunit alpha